VECWRVREGDGDSDSDNTRHSEQHSLTHPRAAAQQQEQQEEEGQQGAAGGAPRSPHEKMR
jgi:hypothetical protein